MQHCTWKQTESWRIRAQETWHTHSLIQSQTHTMATTTITTTKPLRRDHALRSSGQLKRKEAVLPTGRKGMELCFCAEGQGTIPIDLEWKRSSKVSSSCCRRPQGHSAKNVCNAAGGVFDNEIENFGGFMIGPHCSLRSVSVLDVVLWSLVVIYSRLTGSVSVLDFRMNSWGTKKWPGCAKHCTHLCHLTRPVRKSV